MRSLDASAVIAVVLNEPGAALVTRHLRGSLLSAVNYAEVVGSLARRGSKPARVRTVVGALALTVTDLDAELAFRIGELEAMTRGTGLSLGDRACLALAERRNIPVLTADRAWPEVGKQLGIQVELFR
jgi:PIN domain nuclease of toxin-antitoxin system